MGEIAEMMLDGTLCQGCGEYLGGDGYPQFCGGCRPRERATKKTPLLCDGPSIFKTNCPTCKRRVRKVGLADHMRDAHGVTTPPQTLRKPK